MVDIKRKSSMGLLLLASPRFRELGTDTAENTYNERKRLEAIKTVQELSTVTDIVYSGLCYDIEDANRSVEHFKNEHVDFITVIFTSWAEDRAFIHALREITDIPVFTQT